MNLEDDKWCFACGKMNKDGLKMDFVIKGKTSKANFIPKKKHQGYRNIVHGGITTTVLDEAMGKLAWTLGLNTVTVNLNINLKKPVIVGEKYTVYGKILNEQEKKVIAKAELKDKYGMIVADAKGILVRINI